MSYPSANIAIMPYAYFKKKISSLQYQVKIEMATPMGSGGMDPFVLIIIVSNNVCYMRWHSQIMSYAERSNKILCLTF